MTTKNTHFLDPTDRPLPQTRGRAEPAGGPPATARRDLARDGELRAQREAAEGEQALRCLEQVARGQIARWNLSPRKARLLLARLTREEGR